MKMRLCRMVSHYQKRDGDQYQRIETPTAFKPTQISDTMVEMLHNGNELQRLHSDTIERVRY